MAVVLNIMANFVTPYIASFTAGMAGLVLGGLVVTRLPAYRPPEGVQAPDAAPSGFHRAFSAYYILIAVVFAVYLNPPLRAWLNGLLELGLPFPETRTSFGHTNSAVPVYAGIRIFTAPGTLIFVAVVLAYLFYRARSMWPDGGGTIVRTRTTKQALGATLTVMTMSMMAVVMMETGMTGYLASGMAQYFGHGYAVVSPFIGVLGAFMTGSNTSSNILFTGLQREVAALLSISPFVVLGLQTTGGAIGNMFCPMNVALGTGVTNAVGREGECLRATTLYTVIQCLVVGSLAWLMLYVLAPGMP
jgi:lactate permease